MNWKLKAVIQNIIAILPAHLSYQSYYWAQRHFGNLQTISPIPDIRKAAMLVKKIQAAGKSCADATFLEIGTGRRMNVPLALWLFGAKQVVTVDRNPYVREELVAADIGHIMDAGDMIRDICTVAGIDTARLTALREFIRSRWTLPELLELCNIRYLAPADAAALELPDRSIDVHFSNNVFEHIPRETLAAILREGGRVIRDDGIFIHKIDMGDHFAHGDTSITPINFLRFSGKQWRRIAGNRYMYMNRMRLDDFRQLYNEAHHVIMDMELGKRPELAALISGGQLKLDGEFARKPLDILITLEAWVISRKAD